MTFSEIQYGGHRHLGFLHSAMIIVLCLSSVRNLVRITALNQDVEGCGSNMLIVLEIDTLLLPMFF